MRDRVPKDFYRGDIARPIVTNVQELQEQLARLPGDLPIDIHHGGVSLHVYNIDKDARLSFEEPEFS